MRDTDLFQLALGLQSPWTVTRSEFAVGDGQLDLYVDFRRGSRFACAECGREGCAVHDTKDETWRHLDFFQHRTLLHARVPRVICPTCGVRKVAMPWARAGSGFTLLFEAYVLALAKTMPIANAAKRHRLGQRQHIGLEQQREPGTRPSPRRSDLAHPALRTDHSRHTSVQQRAMLEEVQMPPRLVLRVVNRTTLAAALRA